MKYFSIACVVSKSAITPSFNGLITCICSGVLPIISFASLPIANTLLVVLSIATMEGSVKTIPLPLTNINVFAVPKSIPISFEKYPSTLSNITSPLHLFFKSK